MSPERKIDLSTYNGPMTVVGYPDFSATPVQHQETQLFPNKSNTVNGNGHEHKHHHHKKKK